MSELSEKIAKEIVVEIRANKHDVFFGGTNIAAIIDKHLADLEKDNHDLLNSLRCVITNLNSGRKPERKVPLWGAVADFCGLGSTSAGKLCQRLGFHDDLIVGKENPPLGYVAKK